MRIYFCPDCGSYAVGPASACEECRTELPEEAWVEVTEEELGQLEYVDELDLPPGIPTWEYDVVRLKSAEPEGGLTYTAELLDRMGEKGWELVNIVPLGDPGGHPYAVFKRGWSGEVQE